MKFKTHFSLVALLLLFVACNQPAAPTTSAPAQPPAAEAEREIETAIAEIDSGTAVLVDVREEVEWDANHLADAVFIPMSEIEADISAVKTLDKDTKVYVHCQSGKRACLMSELLIEHGYNVVPLKYDFDDLVEAGFEQAEK
jgi:rhodanese-related sulfurtransferase